MHYLLERRIKLLALNFSIFEIVLDLWQTHLRHVVFPVFVVHVLLMLLGYFVLVLLASLEVRRALQVVGRVVQLQRGLAVVGRVFDHCCLLVSIEARLGSPVYAYLIQKILRHAAGLLVCRQLRPVSKIIVDVPIFICRLIVTWRCKS